MTLAGLTGVPLYGKLCFAALPALGSQVLRSYRSHICDQMDTDNTFGVNKVTTPLPIKGGRPGSIIHYSVTAMTK